MAKTKKRKWSHFESGDGKKSKSAKIDGYSFGDRLLEGVMFIITIQEDGTLKAETEPSAKSYMEDLNEKKWLKEALKEAESTDIFYAANNGNEDWVLMDTEGKLNYDDGTPAPQPIIIQTVKIGNLFNLNKAIDKSFGTPEQD
jgi:hypothetical protein